MKVTKEMVDRFLAWSLPKDFGPDCGISFDGRKDDEWNKNKTWPVGTNLLTADQARAMLEHVLAAETDEDRAMLAAGEVPAHIAIPNTIGARNGARYAWLREHWDEITGQTFRGTRPPGRGGYLHHKSDPAAVDEVIDAAMAMPSV